MATLEFPRGFYWGAATAAHQVEGGLDNDWARFERLPRAICKGDRSELGVDHYHRFDADFGLAQSMGHNAHRLSIEWSRIEPERGQWNQAQVDHYHEVLSALRKRGLEPFVTLHHFTNPLWVADQGGWIAERTPEDFARFAAFVGREFRHEVKWWLTINEPNIYAWHGYLTAKWPPRRRSVPLALRVLANFGRAHVLAYQALHAAYDADGRPEKPLVGYSQNLMTIAPYSARSALDRFAVRAADSLFNRSFLEAVTTGHGRFTFPGFGGVRVWYPGARGGTLDFIGVNYYTRAHLRFPFIVLAPNGAPTNDLGWEIYPDGLYEALRLAGEYTSLPDGRRIPVVVTENGMDDRSGERRGAYLIAHIEAVHRAIRDGVDVRGYLHWTLMDNFEWAEGYDPRFGLYRIDRGDGLARIETPAVPIYRAVVERNGLVSELLAQGSGLKRF